ncbi:hypothetical protein [Devosia sediminis]|uniref:Uncharacterized protein n=1 Tax=Devosia sediminis TaxID=2798801 RepID=A0A934MN03_9HYPH|nr:hypothetical protein [Devosia sediminis]MBJ3786256.1 hypothetical protein [Devosia sediminis]
MVYFANLAQHTRRQPALAHWIGQSGRDYALSVESLESFAMAEAALYVIAKGGNVLWVGSADDLVADPMSRTRFRLALDCASHVFRFDAADDRLATIWDLEQAVPAPRLAAQAA